MIWTCAEHKNARTPRFQVIRYPACSAHSPGIISSGDPTAASIDVPSAVQFSAFVERSVKQIGLEKLAVFQGDLTYVDVVEINRVFSLFCDTSIINNDLELSLLRQVLLAPLLNLRSLILLLTVLSVTCLFVFALFFVNYTVKERLIDNSLALNARV